MPTAANVTVVKHPLVQHKLSIMRDRDTGTAEFRRLCREVGMLMAYEVLRDLELTTAIIQTPVAEMQAPVLSGKKLVLAPILRAGIGFCDGVLDLVPAARIAHIGLYRDPMTLTAVEYYFKAPESLNERLIVVIDPMLATGNSAIAAVDRLIESQANDLRLLCLLAAPEGMQNFASVHPNVPIFTAAIDERLNEHGYIVPGLGDAGDRMFGTR
tara:strand:- start:28 stop:666 length:639 start_codon:yes stop_codon:yes gene_type:complete